MTKGLSSFRRNGRLNHLRNPVWWGCVFRGHSTKHFTPKGPAADALAAHKALKERRDSSIGLWRTKAILAQGHWRHTRFKVKIGFVALEAIPA